jgi:hypothetical protein
LIRPEIEVSSPRDDVDQLSRLAAGPSERECHFHRVWGLNLAVDERNEVIDDTSSFTVKSLYKAAFEFINQIVVRVYGDATEIHCAVW